MTNRNEGGSLNPAESQTDSDALQELTVAPLDPASLITDPDNIPSKPLHWKLSGASGLAASLLLASSLLLTGCGNDLPDDCIPSTPPANASSSGGSFGGSSGFGTPGANPSTPASAQFTAGTTNTGQVYCRSRSNGGFYWYSGGYHSSSGSSFSSGGSSS